MHMASVSIMTTTITRRPRNSLVDPKPVLMTLEGPTRQHLSELVEATGANKSALAQWLIENFPLDENGRPVGWPADTRLELPINAA